MGSYKFVFRCDAFENKAQATWCHQIIPLSLVVLCCIQTVLSDEVHASSFDIAVIHHVIDMAYDTSE